jgi:hypothetical protein
MMTPSAMSRMLITPVLREANGRHLTTPCGSGVLAERLKLRDLWQNTVDSVHSVHSDHRMHHQAANAEAVCPGRVACATCLAACWVDLYWCREDRHPNATVSLDKEVISPLCVGYGQSAADAATCDWDVVSSVRHGSMLL